MVPYTLGIFAPITIPLTNSIKPGAQIFSHIAQLYECYHIQTAKGVSLQTQHLNMVGGVSGMIMCLLIPPKSVMTYFLYINSMFQAVSLYAMAIHYDSYSFCGQMVKSKTSSHHSDDEVEPMLGDANV